MAMQSRRPSGRGGHPPKWKIRGLVLRVLTFKIIVYWGCFGNPDIKKWFPITSTRKCLLPGEGVCHASQKLRATPPPNVLSDGGPGEALLAPLSAL